VKIWEPYKNIVKPEKYIILLSENSFLSRVSVHRNWFALLPTADFVLDFRTACAWPLGNQKRTSGSAWTRLGKYLGKWTVSLENFS
jgi:hypothetical protein